MHFFQPLRTPGSSDKQTLLNEIKDALQARIAVCEKAGISRNRLFIDPGFGQGNYGKNAAENYYLLQHLRDFESLGVPLLVGWSRKSMIGETLGGVSPEGRLYGSIAAAVIAAMNGAAIIRVHDVQATKEAIAVYQETYA